LRAWVAVWVKTRPRKSGHQNRENHHVRGSGFHELAPELTSSGQEAPAPGARKYIESLSRRRRSLCGKDPGKVLAIAEEQHKPEPRHDHRAPDAFVIEQQMVEQNIYDYRPKDRQRPV